MSGLRFAAIWLLDRLTDCWYVAAGWSTGAVEFGRLVLLGNTPPEALRLMAERRRERRRQIQEAIERAWKIVMDKDHR
jgi:hypothetical protein